MDIKPRLTCANCEKEFYLYIAGVIVVKYNENDEPEWLRFADLYRCEICSSSVITGYSEKSIPVSDGNFQNILDEGNNKSTVYSI